MRKRGQGALLSQMSWLLCLPLTMPAFSPLFLPEQTILLYSGLFLAHLGLLAMSSSCTYRAGRECWLISNCAVTHFSVDSQLSYPQF